MSDLGLAELLDAARRRRPLVFAHRGGRYLHPENSLLAFRSCQKDGAEGVELDVRPCADGTLVVFHDERLDERTDLRGAVDALPLEEVQGACIRDHEGKLSGEHVPTFAQVLEALPRELFLNVEIKYERGSARRLVEKVVSALDADARRGAQRRIIVSSFSPRILWALRRWGGGYPRGYLVHPDYAQVSVRRGAQFVFAPQALHPGRDEVTEELLADAAAKNRPVLVWTVNKPEQLESLARMGVAALITDRTDVARRVLDSLAGGAA